MKHKMYLKVVSVILIFALILQSIPIVISAETVSKKAEETEADEAYVIGEETRLREESVKHFRMSDGSFTAVSYPSPVHYLDGDGEYKDIDNTLVASQSGYRNSENPFSVTLPEESDGLISVAADGKEITFRLLDSKKVKNKVKEKKHKTEKEIQKEAEKAKTKKEKAKIINDDKYTLKNYSSGVVYAGVSDDVDISYDINGSSLKESIVLNKKNAKSSYTYSFTYTGLTAVLNEDNSVSFMDGDAEYFKLATPYMFDSANAYSSDIEVKLTPTETGCTYELIPNKDWLNDKERVYPITIDPTVTAKLNATTIKDATAIFTNYNSYMESWGKTHSGGEAFDFLTAGAFPDISATIEIGFCIYAAIPNGIPKTARIINAYLSVALAETIEVNRAEDIRINVHKITSDWNTGNINEDSILFTTAKTGGYAIPSFDTEGIDYRYMLQGAQHYYNFDITKAAQDWHNGGNNYGVMLRMDEYSLSSKYLVTFFSSDYNVNGVTNRPVFVYSYRDTSGLEDYWSYHSAAAGDAGTGYVNDFGGNLTFIRNDTSYVNERHNVSIAHVYNSNNSDVTSSYGNGWRLNIGQFGSEIIEGKTYYYYIDGDGTKHYFYDDNGVYKDEDGLGYVYSTVSGDYPKKITTKSHEIMLFDSSGRLRRITDSNSNSVDFTYSTNGLTAVKIGSDNIITLTYASNGKLSSVKNEKTNRTTNYSYDSSGNLINVSESWVYGHTNTYTYSGKLLTSATDSTGYRISYTYTNSGTVNRVQSVSESALDGDTRVDGQTMTFDYKNGNRTVVEDCGVDGNISATADNNKMTYLFDIYGQPVSVYDEDGKGASYKYNNQQNKQHNLTLSSASYGYIPGGELIKNGDFSQNDDFWDQIGFVEFEDMSFSLGWLDEISQNVHFDKGIYKISAKFDKNSEDAELLIDIPSLSSGIVSSNTFPTSGDGEYGTYIQEIEVEIDEECDLTVVFTSYTGFVCIREIQGYKYPYSSKTNYITDGNFDYHSADYENVQEWNMDQAIFGAQRVEMANYTNSNTQVMCIYKSCAPIDVCYNKVYCQQWLSGQAGEVLLLSGWAKATAVSQGTFALDINIQHMDGTYTNKRLDFDKNITDWQFASMPIPIQKEYCRVTVTIDYSNQINTGYFDDIQLIKDDATSYVYDANGNVISAKTVATNSQYKYDGNSRLTSAIDTTGRNFKYNYDDNHNLVSAVSDAATVVRYEYNSYGQATLSETYANTQHEIPQDGGEYYIFLRSTGFYLCDSEDFIDHRRFDPLSYYERFTLNKKSDGCFSIDCVMGENACYLSIEETDGVYSIGFSSSDDTNSTHFRFKKDKNGGYRIISKIGANLCIEHPESQEVGEETKISVATVDEEADNQVWYFELISKKEARPVINENTVYAIRNHYTGRYFTPDEKAENSDINLVVGEHNGSKYVLEKYGETGYYYIRISGTDYVLSYSDVNSITLANYSETDETQLFEVNIHDTDMAGRDTYLVSINPKLNNEMYLSDWAGSTLTAAQVPGHWRSYWFFEEVLYSSSSAEYNADGTKLLSTTDNASGLKTEYEYDDIGRVVKTTAGQRETENQYDNRDRVTAVSSGGADVFYYYNDKNQLSDITVHAGYGSQYYDFSYDTFGNNTKISVGDYTLAQYSYIGNTGLMSQMTYGNNDTIGYTYDNDYRVSEVLYTDKDSVGNISGSKTVKYEYDMFGNVYKLTDGFSGNVTTYNYDLLGRATRISKTDGLSRSITYDAFDRINGYTLSVLGKNIQSSVAYGDFGQVNSFTNTIGDRADTISYTYDDFLRTTSRKLEAINKTSTYSYLKGNDGQDTVLVETLNNGKDTYSYTYDIYGNITSVAKNGTVVENYRYDELNQLTYAKIGEDVYRYTYTLNNSSNLEFVFKNGKIIKSYGYMAASDRTWVDRLSDFTGTVLTYDSIGNPLNWRDNMSLNWSYGRRLTGVTKGTDTISYTYDAEGLRTSKTVNGTTTDYYWLEGVLQGQKTGNEHIIFLYDENGTAYGMLVNDNGTESYYYYLFNLQGDIVGIMDSTGTTVVEYTYDAWGQLLSTTGTLADTIGQKNPLRYRGYYYDTETGFYYLQSRYYDPEVQRFINADGYVSTGQGISGYNMFAYCGNNPINMADPTGNYALESILAVGNTIVNFFAVALVVVGGYILIDAIAKDPPTISLPKIDIKPKSDSKEKDIAPAIPKDPPKKETVIYRYGGTNPGNLTPKAKDKYSGLSFSTVPMPGAAVTTIEELNATGVVYAVQDGPTHVSVRPVGATMEDWINAGSSSVWTQAVKSVVVKWDGGN